MSAASWVGVDLGTQSVRAVAVAHDGVVMSTAAQPLHSIRTGGRHEQHPGEWIAATAAALRAVTAALPNGVGPLGVSVSGTSGTLVAVDARTGAPRGVGVMYDDRRGAGLLPDVDDAGSEVWSRLGYRMQASWGLPTLMQMLRESPLEQNTVIAHQPDVITSMLAGRLLPSDLSSALKTGVDLDEIAWPETVFSALGIPVDVVNNVVASGMVIGEVGPVASSATGLPQGCLIVSGMTDGCAAQIASGALHPGDWNSVLGTTLVVKGSAGVRHVDPTGAVYAHRAPFGGGWYPGGASSSGAGVMTKLLPGRDLGKLTERFNPTAPPPIAYALVGRGERFPFVAPDATGFLPSGDDDELFSAILYGVAYVERLGYDLLRWVGYDIGGKVFVTGGGAKNSAWNQLRADMLGRDISPAVHGEGAVGMAMLAAASLEHRNDPRTGDPLVAVAKRMVPEVKPVGPTASREAALSEGYATFVAHLFDRGWIPAGLRDAAMSGVK
ncbi:FGGY family carbohydrate kinase [Microbacterium sp. ET2]|uniref:FGGY-family carbohydrate kinase n=1 Tax=Microbacterium albipurpureum TaxID=3050384 RepID=UPI00259CF6EA|nr:FGGY family carbohydrate kinase [Microbacterium sp. ET2 (Ac-2212)]WJL96990.1 FGGY family carbohydrate kinase [Microbacterium sp. ET2 (Ac-2212)]